MITSDGKPLFRRVQWSPDGSRIACLKHRTDSKDPGSAGNNIEILSLAGQIEQTIQLKSSPYLQSIDWTADGKALLVPHNGPSGMTLLRVGLDGHVQSLWAVRYFVWSWAIASPDGRYLANMGASLNTNAWLLENF